MVPLAPLARLPSDPRLPPYVVVFEASSTVTDEIVNEFAPVFVTAITVCLFGEVPEKVTLVILSSSVFMKVNVSAPIQAATAIDTDRKSVV